MGGNYEKVNFYMLFVPHGKSTGILQ